MPSCAIACIAIFAIFFAPTVVTAQVVVGQIDSFQDGTTDNWGGALAPNQPENVPNGGPAGAGDAFLQITSTGTSGAGSRMVTLNDQQWSGGQTYSPAVTGISMDVKDLGTTALTIRLAFQDTSSGTYSSTVGFSLPADGTWHSAMFSLLDPNMTTLTGSRSFSAALASGIAEMRIVDVASPAFVGDVVAGTLGVDNIKAVGAVPEPGSFALVATAVGMATLRRWQRKSQSPR